MEFDVHFLNRRGQSPFWSEAVFGNLVGEGGTLPLPCAHGAGRLTARVAPSPDRDDRLGGPFLTWCTAIRDGKTNRRT